MPRRRAVAGSGAPYVKELSSRYLAIQDELRRLTVEQDAICALLELHGQLPASSAPVPTAPVARKTGRRGTRLQHSADDRAAAQALSAKGLSVGEIATKLGVSYQTAWGWLKRKPKGASRRRRP